MKYIILSTFILYSVVGIGQKSDGGRLRIWTGHVTINGPNDSTTVYTLVFDQLFAMTRRIDSLEARIKVLEERPYLAIIPAPDSPSRGIWMLQAHGGYAIPIKQFNYPKP